MADPRRVQFFFDYLSPNAYLAWRVLPDLAARHGARVDPVPVLFAGLLGAHGQLGPAEVPAKMAWMWRNNVRKAALLGEPLEPPAFHPFNPLLALRVSSLELEAGEREALIGGLFRAVWAEKQHVSEPEVVAEVATRAGLDGPSLVARAAEPAAKARLREQTDHAIAQGVFGIPSMLLTGELFWGYDDLPYLEHRLAGRDPIDSGPLAFWPARPPASATRKQELEKGSKKGDGP